MCLSTPTTTQTNGTTKSCTNKAPCNINTINGSSTVVSLRKIYTTTTETTATTSINTQTQNQINKIVDAKNSKDIEDNLGYKEENAVYKEITASDEVKQNLNVTDEMEYKPSIRWPDLMAQLFLHLGGVYGFFLLFSAHFYTFLWVIFIIWSSGVGITAGVHRLWSHKSYTASLSLRILLVFLFTIAGQRDAYTWALDHRIHHKFSETEADPHNAKRGFFFAHIGWLFLTPHPKVVQKRKIIDMSDLENDNVVMFQRKWYIPLFAICSIGLPVLVPCFYWNEDLWLSFWINFNMRFCCTLNIAFFVNSVAHMWGGKPYDKNISPVESPIVSFLALGEGWHNYHHVFPWDYKTGEFGSYNLNPTTAFIDFCAKVGLARARKFVSPEMVLRRAAKCGDGSRFLTDEFAHQNQVWGYGDKDLPVEDVEELAKMKS